MANAPSKDLKYKILFVGDSCVGKTSFINKYCDGVFTNSFIATVGIDLKVKRLERKGMNIKLEIWDTAGQERYRAITPAMYNRAEGFVVMFDLTNRQSYCNCQHWVETVLDSVDSPIIVLVGNKTDLANKRTMTLKEGKEFASRRGMEYFECSIKGSEGMEEVMEHLVSKLITRSTRIRVEDSITISKAAEFDEKDSATKEASASRCISC